MHSQTIRKNSTKRIAAILSVCEFIRVHRYDDMGDDNRAVTADEVLDAGAKFEFDRVYLDEQGCIRLYIHSNYGFTGYPTLELAAAGMTEHAVIKYGIRDLIIARELAKIS